VQSRLSNQKAFASSIACEVTSNGLSCTFNLTGIPPGTYTLEIMDKYGNIVYRAGQFEVI
jgi:hypothetical protein